MNEQSDFFKALQMGERLRERGISMAGKHAPDGWKECALTAVIMVSRKKERFTTDDVWAYMENGYGSELSTPEPRAMGAIMRMAQSEGYIRPLHEWRLSVRPQCHRRPLRVWRSCHE